jgi:hypothetical protein
MGKHGVPTSRKLILALADSGGSLTLTEVSRRFRGRLSVAARKETAGLVDFTRSHSKATHRPAWKLSLTTLGVAYAQTLKIGWKPARLTIADWLAQLAEMTAERVPAALRIARALTLAAEHDAREAAREAADRAQKKAAAERARKPKVKRGQSEWFKQNVLNEPVFRIPSPASVARAPIGAVPAIQPVQPRTPEQSNLLPRPLGSPKEICSYCNGRPEEAPFHDCRNYQSPLRYGNASTTTGPAIRTREGNAPDKSNGRERERIRAIIRERGYGDALLPNGKVLFDNREVWPEGWAKEHGLA